MGDYAGAVGLDFNPGAVYLDILMSNCTAPSNLHSYALVAILGLYIYTL